MKKVFLLLLGFYWIALLADSQYPADISFLICDLKYSQEYGLKICEVQQGSLSMLSGDHYVTEGEGTIIPALTRYFERFPMQKWLVGLGNYPLKIALKNNGWELTHSLSHLFKQSTLLDSALLPPVNPSSISSYSSIIYSTPTSVKEFNANLRTYPGFLFVDAANISYWRDKYKMSVLFNCKEALKEYKADWALCPKKYDPNLAVKIQEDMPSDLYVIKPRGEFLGNGVIIVASHDLDAVLHLILEDRASLRKHPDKHYAYWYKNKSDSFLIERYFKSDAIPLNDDQNFHYDATMRMGFVLEYDDGITTFHCLGGYWKLPCKALEEEGTLNEKHISFGSIPFFKAVDPDLLEEVSAKMEHAMLLLYEVMLNAKNVLSISSKR